MGSTSESGGSRSNVNQSFILFYTTGLELASYRMFASRGIVCRPTMCTSTTFLFILCLARGPYNLAVMLFHLLARIETEIKIFTLTMYRYNSEHNQSCDQNFTR